MQEGIGSRVLGKIESRPANSSAARSALSKATTCSSPGAGWCFSVRSPCGPCRFI
jgi:hypothetical protein